MGRSRKLKSPFSSLPLYQPNLDAANLNGLDGGRDLGAPPMITRLGTKRSNVRLEVVGDDHGQMFVWLMILLNTGVFLWSMFLNDWQFEPLSINPTLGPSASVLDDLGAKNTPKIVQDNEWHRLFTPMFLHGGIIHIALNMFMLKRLGGSIEESFGYFRIAIIYFASGVSGVLASCVFLPSTLSVGASGALYGLIGALYGDFLHNWKTMLEGRTSYFVSLVLNTALGLTIGLLPMIDNFAHVGGAIAGFLLGSVLLVMPHYDHDGERVQPWYADGLKVVAAIMLVLWYGMLTYFLILEKDAHQWCTSCRYISCVDTPWWSCAIESTS